MADNSSGKSPLAPVLKATPEALIGIGAVGVATSGGLNPAAWAAVAVGAAMWAGKVIGKKSGNS